MPDVPIPRRFAHAVTFGTSVDIAKKKNEAETVPPTLGTSQ